MNSVPAAIDGARVLRYTPIDSRHRPTGRCHHNRNGAVPAPRASLAICQYDGDNGFYLFGCDESWNVLTDTYHGDLNEAERQAEFEYEGVSATWQGPPQSFEK